MTTFTTEQQDFLVAFFTAKAETWANDGEDSDAVDAKQAAEVIATSNDIGVACKVFSGFDMEEELLYEIAEIDERDDIVNLLVGV